MALHARLQKIANAEPDVAHSEIVRALGDWLWRRWRPGLAPLGLHPKDLRAALAGYEREAWLWVMGDRSWEQMIGGLLGRLSRRVEAAPPPASG